MTVERPRRPRGSSGATNPELQPQVQGARRQPALGGCLWGQADTLAAAPSAGDRRSAGAVCGGPWTFPTGDSTEELGAIEQDSPIRGFPLSRSPRIPRPSQTAPPTEHRNTISCPPRRWRPAAAATTPPIVLDRPSVRKRKRMTMWQPSHIRLPHCINDREVCLCMSRHRTSDQGEYRKSESGSDGRSRVC